MHAVGTICWGSALAGRSRVRFPMVLFRIFRWVHRSGCTVFLGSTQTLTEISTGNISWEVKDGRCVGWTNLHASCAEYHEIWESQPPGTLRVYPGLRRDCFTFTCNYPIYITCSVHTLWFVYRDEYFARNRPANYCKWTSFCVELNLSLTWRIWWAPNNASKWQMGFNSALRGYIWK